MDVMYQYLKKVNHFANVGGGYISLFFQQLTVPAMGFSIRLSHRHLKLDMSKWASLFPSLLPDLLHFLGPPLSWMSSSPIQVSKPGIWLHAGLLPLLHPAQATRLSASPMDSVSCDSLHRSSPPVPLLIYEFRALSLTSTAVIALYSGFALTSNSYLKKNFPKL